MVSYMVARETMRLLKKYGCATMEIPASWINTHKIGELAEVYADIPDKRIGQSYTDCKVMVVEKKIFSSQKAIFLLKKVH